MRRVAGISEGPSIGAYVGLICGIAAAGGLLIYPRRSLRFSVTENAGSIWAGSLLSLPRLNRLQRVTCVRRFVDRIIGPKGIGVRTAQIRGKRRQQL